jgi:hypothetical protein
MDIRDDPKIPFDGGEVPKTKWSGLCFDSQMWKFLLTWRKNQQEWSMVIKYIKLMII